ncbi:MAG: hypothetical protein KIT76_15965 [Pseudolabrys sp.]|nr:hypothetical protein [Pseudolabrys sp.]
MTEAAGPSRGTGGRRRVQPQRRMRLRKVVEEMPYWTQMSSTGVSPAS